MISFEDEVKNVKMIMDDVWWMMFELFRKFKNCMEIDCYFVVSDVEILLLLFLRNDINFKDDIVC